MNQSSGIYEIILKLIYPFELQMGLQTFTIKGKKYQNYPFLIYDMKLKKIEVKVNLISDILKIDLLN